MRKKNQMFVLDPHYKSLQFPNFLRVHPPSRVRWGHARRHGKRSLGMLTVEGADYTQKWIVITSIPGQYIDEAFANHG